MKTPAPPNPPAPGPTGHRPRPPAPEWAVVASLAFAGMCSAFMFTLVVPLQADLPRLLDASRSDTSWVVTITLLVSAVATPISGRLGDMYGKRRVLVYLLAALMVGSLICTFAPSIEWLILGRGLQGITSGTIPLGIAVMRDVLPAEKLGTAVALMSATMGAGGAFGMPLAAYLAQGHDWRTLFWVSFGLGLIGALAIRFVLPRDTLFAPGRLDLLGVLGLAGGLTGLLLYVSRGGTWGWGSPVSLGTLAAGVLVLAVWGVYQWRTHDPLVDLRVASRPAVLLTNLAAIGMGFAMFGSQVSFPQLMQLPQETGIGMGLTMVESALCIMPAGIIMMVLSPLSGHLQKAFGPRPLFTVGTTGIVVSYVFVLLWSDQVWHIVVASCGVGLGIAFSFAAMPMIIMRAVPADETGVSNGLNALFRSIGTSSAAAVMGGVLATQVVRVEGLQVNTPTADAFALCFWIAIGAAAVAMALTFFIPRHRPEDTRRTCPTD